MADLYFDVDTVLAEVPVNIMPLLDDGDFKAREESVTYDQAGLDLVWNFVTTAGAMTQTAVTPTTGGGDYDWTNQGNGMYSIGIVDTGGASINNDTEGFGWFTGYATGILPWRGPVCCFRAAGLNNLLVDSAHSATRGLAGTALPNADADAAGGLPTTAKITDARLAVLTDWINGGRLDLILDSAAAGAIAAEAAIAVVDGIVDTILVDTNELQANQGNWVTATGFSTHTAANVVTAMQAVGTVLAKLLTAIELDGAVYRLTENALEQAPSGSGATAAEVVTALKADAQWKQMLAKARGKTVWDDSAKTLKFYDTDNTTLLFTLTLSSTGRTVA